MLDYLLEAGVVDVFLTAGIGLKLNNFMFTFEFKWQRCLYGDREGTGLHWIGHGVNYSERGMLARS